MSKVYIREDGLRDIRGLTLVQTRRIINSLNHKNTVKAGKLAIHLAVSKEKALAKKR